MHHVRIVLAIILITAPAPSGTIGFRLGAGVEIIPLKYMDLHHYNCGVGGDFRSDIVWGSFSTTSIEIGYREFPIGGAWPTSSFTLRRFGLIQRFYPLYFRNPKLSPYLGLGITASNRERFSLNFPDADYGGVLALIGLEIPYKKNFHIDPAIRWDFFSNTDYFYSGIGLSVHVVWKIH